MNFDFGKFATMTVDTVESAFSEKPERVIADIAKEIKSEEVKAPVKSLTAEQIKQQAEFLKQQKEKSEAKEDKVNIKDSNKKKEDTKKETTKVKSTPKPKPEPKVEEPIVYSRDRRVIAYGEEVYVEEDTTASLDAIRGKLVAEYGYSEFKDANRCKMVFDAKTGDVYPEIIFNKKG